MSEPTSRRSFLKSAGLGAAALGLTSTARAEEPKIQGFEQEKGGVKTARPWQPISDRKVRFGIVGYGVCKFGAAFSLQNHPNVEVVAVSDLFPDRCQALARVCKCEKTYPSLEEMVKDDSIEAIFVATDAPSHCRHCIDVLKHGKHVATAVPAVWAELEDADKLYEVVRQSGLNYMMFETSCYHADLFAMRTIFESGGFGKLVYSEGQYFHYACSVIPSYKDWRIGLPPQWYPTHSNAYYVGVTGGSFTEVSCMGMSSIRPELQPENNRYQNPFGTEIAMFRTSEGGVARMGVSWDTPGYGGETGRVRGQKGSMNGMNFQGTKQTLPDLARPPLPPSVQPGGHGGSHGYLGHEMVMSILENRKPLVNVAWALNMTVAGIVAHQSALKDGQLMKIPQYTL
ncbi:MAG: Gfo/Idh/MocA family oxidoreductase [Planctomycetia bacterium]|nr:MAG: Gfo/Idh/MocA family oxidoreductase [Planctomycetia bacterium]